LEEFNKRLAMMPGAYLINGELYVNNKERAEMWILKHLCEEQHRESTRLAFKNELSLTAREKLKMPPENKLAMENYLKSEPVKTVNKLHSNLEYAREQERINKELVDAELKRIIPVNNNNEGEIIMYSTRKLHWTDRAWASMCGYTISAEPV
jgi:hypothetical protein